MFYTFPEAEVRIPKGLAAQGERSWRWVELGLQIPYYLLSVQITTQETEMVRHLLLGQLGDVLDMAAQQTDTFQILHLNLLSPGYMNCSDSYQLATVKEIWSVKGAAQPNVFVLSDGSRLRFGFGRETPGNEEMELLLAL